MPACSIYIYIYINGECENNVLIKGIMSLNVYLRKGAVSENIRIVE